MFMPRRQPVQNVCPQCNLQAWHWEGAQKRYVSGLWLVEWRLSFDAACSAS